MDHYKKNKHQGWPGEGLGKYTKRLNNKAWRRAEANADEAVSPQRSYKKLSRKAKSGRPILLIVNEYSHTGIPSRYHNVKRVRSMKQAAAYIGLKRVFAFRFKHPAHLKELEAGFPESLLHYKYSGRMQRYYRPGNHQA